MRWCGKLNWGWKTKVISDQLLETLVGYLSAGYSLQLGLELLESHLSGEQFYDLIPHEHPLLEQLMKVMPLVNAIKGYLSWQLTYRQLRQQLGKLMVYPLVQLVMALGLSGLLQGWLLPALLTLVEGEISGLWVLGVLQGLLVVVVVGLLVMGVLGWREPGVVLWWCQRFPQQWYAWWCVIRWLEGWLLIRQHCGVSIDQVRLLRELPLGVVAGMWSQRMHHQLMMGYGLAEAMEVVYPPLVKVVRTGVHTQQLDELLGVWKLQLVSRLQRQLKFCSYGLQGFVYVYVGLLVWVVSQVMLVPLGLLERI